MKKYLAVARITLANILEYRWDFLIGQLRVTLLLITLYFLWTQIISTRINIFGFSKNQIITYIFLAAILRQFTLTTTADQIAAELQSWGKFFSYLLRPIGYFRYWFTVDLVYKIANLVLILVIASLFINFFNIYFINPPEISSLFLFILSILIAIFLNFYAAILVSATGFWTSQVWGLQFFLVLIMEFSAGVYFPIDVLPQSFRSIIQLTPFPYLLYYPIAIFLGKLSPEASIRAIFIGLLWLTIIYALTKFIWQKGLKAYEAWGG